MAQLETGTETQSWPEAELRPPEQVMRLKRMGSFFPTRLSFLRSLLRKLATDGMQLKRPVWNLDDNGFGHAVYEVMLDGQPYSLIAFSSHLDPENRTDRVIAQAWDACFVLFDGRPTKADIEEMQGNATKQEAGRYHPGVLVLSRANKSVRLFDHVVQSLAAGDQPDGEMIGKIGYLMRTTAVYGNGKFGMADRADFMNRETLSQPFRLEMLTVYLIREFTLDLVEHVAGVVGVSKAVGLADNFRRQLGIGNSTGLGMAPFLVSHPVLINNWMMVRETALARVRAIELARPETFLKFNALAAQVSNHLDEWNVDDEPEQARIESLREEWATFKASLRGLLKQDNPWNAIVEESLSGSIDLQELVVALVLEPHGELIDGLCDCMEDTVGTGLDPRMTVGTLLQTLEEKYDWALATDLDDPKSRAMVWYVSEEKLEPRFGERDPSSEERREMPHHIVHKVQALMLSLKDRDVSEPVAVMLMACPEHRDIVRRVQTTAAHPYAEIRDNLVAEGVRPIDLLRCKLSFFGASKFDPRSDKWTRITLYQGAPTARDLTLETAGDVFLPAFGAV